MRDRWIALLRGINVGGKNKLPMRELVPLFTQAGCTDVATYIQSGNVVFTAGRRLGEALARELPLAIEQTFALQVPVVLRTATELRRVIAANPFVARGEDPDHLHVAFLATRPTAARVETLDPDRSPPDQFAVRGREVYLLLPDGAARSKLTNAWLENQLATVSTARNWRTCRELLALSTASG